MPFEEWKAGRGKGKMRGFQTVRHILWTFTNFKRSIDEDTFRCNGDIVDTITFSFSATRRGSRLDTLGVTGGD